MKGDQLRIKEEYERSHEYTSRGILWKDWRLSVGGGPGVTGFWGEKIRQGGVLSGSTIVSNNVMKMEPIPSVNALLSFGDWRRGKDKKR